MKVALLLPAEPEKAPYIQYYIDVFKEKGIEYDVIAWNRSGNNPKVLERLIMYEAPSPDTLSNIKKVRGFWGFKQFVEKTVRQKQYDRLVVHTIMLAVFMSSFLKRYYGGKYILDIRDEGSLYGIMKLRLPVLLKYSFCNVISSWGFKTWLPEAEYVISHNIGFRWKEKMNMPAPDSFFHHQPLDILTIGQIRHFDGNRVLIDELGNRGNMKMHFAGDGVDVPRLVEYCKEKKINNVISEYNGLGDVENKIKLNEEKTISLKKEQDELCKQKNSSKNIGVALGIIAIICIIAGIGTFITQMVQVSIASFVVRNCITSFNICKNKFF